MSNDFTKVVTLEDVNNGAIQELFQDEYQKLLNNLGDENTSWKVQREITIKLKVKLNSEERSSASSTVDVSAKLAPPKGNETIIHLDTDGSDVHAFSRAEPEQLELDNITDIKEGTNG